MKIQLIAACDRNRVIGTADGGMPWDLPVDKAHLRRQAAGCWMLLGRSTFEEMDGWFTNQRVLVLSGSSDYRPAAPGMVAGSITEALARAREGNAPLLLVAGGARVFESTIALADQLIITHVDVDWQQENKSDRKSAGDLPRFPRIDPARWRLVRRIEHPADDDHPWPLAVCWYQRGSHAG